VAGLGALMIHVTNSVGSRFFSYFNTNAGLFCSKIGNENKRKFGAESGNLQFQHKISRWP
jgi:hypothetical protein